MSNAGDTIFATASGSGRAAISIVRVSGPQAGSAIKCLCGRLPVPRVASYVSIRDPAQFKLIDKAIVLWFPGPRSPTGEDCAEFHVHGGVAILTSLFKALSRVGDLRPAKPGEFSRRAFVHGKIDLIEAEAINDLTAARTETQLQQALGLLSRDLHPVLSRWRRALIEILAHITAQIDFGEEGDVASHAAEGYAASAKQVKDDIAKLGIASRASEIIRDGFCVVIAGPPNVGKSSLLNVLAKRDVAIVSQLAGTTRDIIEVRLDLNGQEVILVDTAGLHAAADLVEAEGIRRAIDRAQRADLILWLDDVRVPVGSHALFPDAANIIEVLNKSDLAPGRSDAMLVSARTGEGIDKLLEIISQTAARQGGPSEISVLVTSRHKRAMERAVAHLALVESHPEQIELVAEDLRLAVDCLDEIVGGVAVEDVLDEVFSSFCIGK